jgi:hypothetical protein
LGFPPHPRGWLSSIGYRWMFLLTIKKIAQQHRPVKKNGGKTGKSSQFIQFVSAILGGSDLCAESGNIK